MLEDIFSKYGLTVADVLSATGLSRFKLRALAENNTVCLHLLLNGIVNVEFSWSDVPDGFNYAAINNDGGWVLFQHKPIPNEEDGNVVVDRIITQLVLTGSIVCLNA